VNLIWVLVVELQGVASLLSSVQALAQAAMQAAVQAAMPLLAMLLAMLLVRLALGRVAQVLPQSALPAVPVVKSQALLPRHLRQAQMALLLQTEELKVLQP